MTLNYNHRSKRSILAVVLCTSMVLFGSCKKESNIIDNENETKTTISGSVIDVYTTPCPGLTVRVPGCPDVITAADGSFTIPNVPPVYDIAVIDQGTRASDISIGLSTSSPTLVSPVLSTGVLNKATVHVIAPATGDKKTWIVLSGFEMPTWTSLDSTATMTAQWGAAVDSIISEATLIRFSGSGLSIQCDGTAHKTVIIRKGGTTSIEFRATELTDPDEADITGSILPSGGAAPVTMVGYEPRLECAGFRIPFGGVSGTSSSFSLRMPKIQGATYAVQALANNALGTSTTVLASLVPGTSGASVSLLGVPSMDSPAVNATGVDGQQTLRWTPVVASGRYWVHVWTSRGQSFTLNTMTSSFPLSKLASLGLSLQSGATYSWQVTQWPWVSSMNAGAERKTVVALLWGLQPNSGSSVTFERTFQTR